MIPTDIETWKDHLLLINIPQYLQTASSFPCRLVDQQGRLEFEGRVIEFWVNAFAYNIIIGWMERDMIYCHNLFTTDANNQLLYVVIGTNVLLILFILLKMCQLCSKAFSYTNFHIHETYKLYTLAILSILIISLTRISQIDINDDVGKLDSHGRQQFFTDGYCIWNELIGSISIYVVNQMYLLNGFTWLMIANQCDFREKREFRSINSQERQEELVRKRKRTHIIKLLLLYFLIPAFLLGSTFCIISNKQHFQGNQLRAIISRTLINISSFITCGLWVYSLGKILVQRRNDPTTPRKIKMMWVYLILVTITRTLFFLYATLRSTIDWEDSKKRIDESYLYDSVFVFLYSTFLTFTPILILSYLSEKQLQKERLEILRNPTGIFFTSSIL